MKIAAPSEELNWTVDELRIAGRAWGPEDGHRVLALHGWLDHAGSFDAMAPLLSATRVVALDLTGHGLSDHRSADATYAIWDDIPQVLGVADRLGWSRFTLLGHSRGAMIALLISALCPERVSGLVTLDALLPVPTPTGDVVHQMRRFLDDTARLKARGTRVYPDEESFLRRRQALGNAPEVAERLAERAMERTAEGLRVRADPRLQAASCMRLSRAQQDAFLRAVEAPVLSIWAADGLAKTDHVAAQRARAAQLLSDFRDETLPGDHHFHLHPDSAQRIADKVAAFLARTG